MKDHTDILHLKIRQFKRKYYKNLLLKQAIFFTALALALYLLIASTESLLGLDSLGRTVLLFSTLGALLLLCFRLVVMPALKIIRAKSQLGDQEASEMIGRFFPEIKDKLLNTLQLKNLSAEKNSLILADIAQRTAEISPFDFTQTIDLAANKRYLKYIAYPSAVLMLLFLFVPQFLTESTQRIVHFNQEYTPASLYTIEVLNEDFRVFKNEDFSVRVVVSGSAIPEKIWVNNGQRKAKMKAQGDGIWSYTFTQVQSDFSFSIATADEVSGKHRVSVLLRPDMRKLQVTLDYPRYTRKASETFTNHGNLTIPEGTRVQWLVQTTATDSANFYFHTKQKTLRLKPVGEQTFEGYRTLYDTEKYALRLKNKNSRNKDSIPYEINIVKDEYPKLSLQTYQDTTLYAFMVLSGSVSDDYGITQLELMVKKQEQQQSIPIPFSQGLTIQNYFYQWKLDDLSLKEGESVEYFVRAWDNDGIHGRKSTRSGTYTFKKPDKKEIKEKIDRQAEGTNSELARSQKEMEEVNQQLEAIQNDLKSNQELKWQEKKKINDLLKQKERLEEALKKISEQNKAFSQKQNHFNQPNKKLREKAQQLQKLMDDLLDDKTKQLYQELKRLLDQQKSPEQIEQAIDKIKNREENLEKEIERAIEMFKRIRFDYKLDEIVNDLEQLQQKQEQLADETLDKDSNLEALSQEQEALQEELEQVEEKLAELDSLNEALKQKENLEDLSEAPSEIKDLQQQSQNELQQKKRKKAARSQKSAAQQIKKMKERTQQMQSAMEMTMMQENLSHLKHILDDLVKISFDQESLMKSFRDVHQSDPKYVTLSQEQLKLRDDAVIIEDSLLSLASRVFQIQSFVTREVDAMKDRIDNALQALKDRHPTQATTEQQYAMTSVNNLALLLEDVLKQMQQQMAEAMGKGKPQKGGKKKLPGLSELQKQLNKQIEALKKSGKSGRALSEELAKLAAEQEMLRNELKGIEEQLGGSEGEASENLKEAMKKMEETEIDLVNKQLYQQTIERQKDILTRMLKAEKALREQELDDQREAEQATKTGRKIPPDLKQYLEKIKTQETELLNTLPPKMNPYYKEEIKKYFKRLNRP